MIWLVDVSFNHACILFRKYVIEKDTKTGWHHFAVGSQMGAPLYSSPKTLQDLFPFLRATLGCLARRYTCIFLNNISKFRFVDDRFLILVCWCQFSVNWVTCLLMSVYWFRFVDVSWVSVDINWCQLFVKVSWMSW